MMGIFKLKKTIGLALCLTVLLVAGCGTGLNIGETVEVANSGYGICGEYLGYKEGQKLVRDFSNNRLYGIHDGQAVIAVTECGN